MTEPEQPVVAVPLRAALDLIGHDIHAAFWGGVAPQHNKQPGSDEPFGDCYKCRIVADKLAESAARHGVEIRAALAVEAVRPETDIDPEVWARAVTNLDLGPEHAVLRVDIEAAQREIAEYKRLRATPLAERPE